MNRVNIHICENSRLRQDLSKSENDRVIIPFREGLFSRNFALAQISEFTVKPVFLTTRLSISSIDFDRYICSDILFEGLQNSVLSSKFPYFTLNA